MLRFQAIFIRVIKELLRDKRTLALMMLAPIIVISLMNVVFDTNEETNVIVGVDETIPTALTETFPSEEVEVIHYSNSQNVQQKIKTDSLAAFITLEDEIFHITYENEDPSNTGKVRAIFQSSLTANRLEELGTELQKIAQQTGQSIPIPELSIEETYVYGNEDSTFFDKIFPILIGFFVFFFIFLISGIALLRERTGGTLERLLATPVKRSELVFGYLAGYGIFAILQTLLIIFYSIYILNLEIVGSLLWVIVTNILLALVALSMGLFVSTFANSEFQMVQFIPLIVVPQIFFSGLIPLESMATWVRYLSYLFPLSYAGEALTNIMIKGQGGRDIALNLGILGLFIVGFTCINIVGLKRYRKV